MSLKQRWKAFKFGMAVAREGFFAFAGIKQPGGFLSTIGQLLQPKWGEPPKKDGKEWLEMYGKSPRLRPVYKIAKDVAAADWKLYVKKGKDKVAVEDHILYDLIAKPNPKMSGYIMRYLTEVWLQLRGEAGWLIERNGLKVPSELWPIPPHWVKSLPTKSKPYFRVDIHGTMVNIAPEDMVWFTEPDPVNPYSRGLGNAQGIGDEVETDEYMAKWAKRFFFNDATPPFYIKAPGIQKEQADRLLEQWMERYSGYWNSHKPAILNWDGEVKELNRAQKEMDFVESRKFLRDTANQHFMLPPEVMGIVENSNRATIETADYLYSKNVLKPCLDLIQEQVNLQLVPQFDEKLIWGFDNPIPEDKEFKLKQANDGIEQGAMLVDEWREANGKDPLPDGRGQVLYVPFNKVVTPVNELGEGSRGQDNRNSRKIRAGATKELTEEQKTAIWNAFDKSAQRRETGVIRDLKKFFQAQQNEITKKLTEILGEEDGFYEGLQKAGQKDIDNLIERLINWTAQNDKLKGVLKTHWLTSMEDGWETATDTFGLEVNFELLTPAMTEWIDTNGAEKVKGINQTTRTSLSETLTEGIREGESIPKLRDRVTDVFNAAKGYRSEVIARTETHNSMLYGTFETYRVAGVKKKEWLTTRDGRERDSHAAIDGEVRDIGERFSNGLMYPGDPNGRAEEVVQCRCALLPVLEE